MQISALWIPGWPTGMALPRDAKLVVFPGWRDPAIDAAPGLV
jgi:hypothetical protein